MMAFSRDDVFREARRRVKQAYMGRDSLLVHTVNGIDELDKVANLLMERLREWYGIYLPELKVADHEAYCKVVLLFDKSNLEASTLTEILGEEKAKELIAAAKNSIGAEFAEEDLKEVRALANQVVNIYAFRHELDEYQAGIVKKMAPNLCHLVEPALAAKLIAQAGSLQKLALFPASTVQVLGAEKALFKHLRQGTLPPKYGLIFQHPLIGNAPPGHRGKLARALATKLAIAAKADAFSHEFIADKLKATFEKRCAAISKLPRERKSPPTQQRRPDFQRRGNFPPRREGFNPRFKRRFNRGGRY